ncbi:MAG: metal ABC transporter ATP-binding protein [Firmicutes bacterium]|nr:metal ABC transporter ATP-binding protein [Bacillota bacterium]
MALIKCENVALGYEDSVAAENISFEVNRGDYLYIIGENGSGKSTLIKGLLGLIKPIRGKIVYGDGLKKNRIGYLPQQKDAKTDFPASVYEVVISGCAGREGLSPFYSRDAKERACSAMRKLGIHDLQNRSFRELSGGQRQRVLLARALCATDSLLLLDEPSSGLDPVVTAEMYKITDELNKTDGVTVITVSHDLQAAAEDATHILHMKKSPLFYGTRDEYLKSDVWSRLSGANEGENKPEG